MPDLDIATIEALARLGAPMLILGLAAWVLKPFFASWAETHRNLVNDVNATNKSLATTQQQMAVTMESLSSGQEQAQKSLDQLLQRKP